MAKANRSAIIGRPARRPKEAEDKVDEQREKANSGASTVASRGHWAATTETTTINVVLTSGRCERPPQSPRLAKTPPLHVRSMSAPAPSEDSCC